MSTEGNLQMDIEKIPCNKSQDTQFYWITGIDSKILWVTWMEAQLNYMECTLGFCTRKYMEIIAWGEQNPYQVA